MSEVKQLDRLTPANKIVIFAPRWRDQTILIAKYKVGIHNEIIFTKAPSMGDNHFYLSGETIRNSPTDTNGKIPVYSVPMNELKILERT